jgi:hypothetical protein
MSQNVKLTILKSDDYDYPSSRYAHELSEAIKIRVPDDTKVNPLRTDKTDMNLFDAIGIEIVSIVVLKLVFEGLEWYHQHRGKVRIQLETDGKVFVVDETKGELAAAYAAIERRLNPTPGE